MYSYVLRSSYRLGRDWEPCHNSVKGMREGKKSVLLTILLISPRIAFSPKYSNNKYVLNE
jgi:hypothetical protein